MRAPLRTVIVVVIALAATPARAAAEPVTAPVSTWVPDGEVNAMAISGSTAYIGGNFTRIAPYTGPSALFDASTGELKPWPEVEGVVNAVAADGAGGWYLGGDSGRSAASPDRPRPRARGPHGRPELGPVDRRHGAGAGAPRRTPVFAGGEFWTANGTARGHLAEFSRADGTLTAFTGGVSNSGFDDFKGVHALLLNNPTLYVGGIFDSAQGSNGSATRHRVAAFDVPSSQVKAWDPDANHTVNGLAVDPDTTDGDDVFISGRFNALKDNNTPDEVARHGIAKVDATSGVADSGSIPPLQFGPELTSMVVSGTQVYIGGGNINFGNGKLPAAAIKRRGQPHLEARDSVRSHPFAASGSTIYIGTGQLRKQHPQQRAASRTDRRRRHQCDADRLRGPVRARQAAVPGRDGGHPGDRRQRLGCPGRRDLHQRGRRGAAQSRGDRSEYGPADGVRPADEGPVLSSRVRRRGGRDERRTRLGGRRLRRRGPESTSQAGSVRREHRRHRRASTGIR